MKLATIRSACVSIRACTSRPGSRFGGLAQGCLPTNSRLTLRTASTAPSSGTSPTLTANFGKQHKEDDWSKRNRSMGEVVQNTKEAIATLQRRNPEIQPLLVILQAGEDDSMLEVNKKTAGKIGLNVSHICLVKNCSEDEIVEELLKLNDDPRVHGVFLHLPPTSLTSRVLNTLKPEKDVDGISDLNIGRLVRGDVSKGFIPPIASAVLDLLGKH
ncbi:hypothetical protein ILYODFUR_000663, partial [Ilyodon furcidens]